MLPGYGGFFCNSRNLHTRDVTKKASYRSHIDFIIYYVLFICLLRFIVPLENLSLIWRRHHCRWMFANVDLWCLAPMAIEQWGFSNVPQSLQHGPTVYNVHLRGPVTLTSVAERLAGSCHYRFSRLKSVATGNRTPDLPHARRTPYIYATAAVSLLWAKFITLR